MRSPLRRLRLPRPPANAEQRAPAARGGLAESRTWLSDKGLVRPEKDV
jgi:hypothetical protein